MSSEVTPHSKTPVKISSEGAVPGEIATITDPPLKFCASLYSRAMQWPISWETQMLETCSTFLIPVVNEGVWVR